MLFQCTTYNQFGDLLDALIDAEFLLEVNVDALQIDCGCDEQYEQEAKDIAERIGATLIPGDL